MTDLAQLADTSFTDRRDMACRWLLICFGDLLTATEAYGTYSGPALRAHEKLSGAANALNFADIIAPAECSRLTAASRAIAFGEPYEKALDGRGVE